VSKNKVHINAVNIRLSNLLHQGLSRIARSKGMTNSEYMRFLLLSAIEKDESK